MKKIGLLILLFPFLCQGQKRMGIEKNVKRDAIYIEALGNGGYTLTLNYEKLNRKKEIGYRVGFGYLDYDVPIISIPFELIMLKSINIHSIEASIGATYMRETDSGYKSFVYFGRLGYRYSGTKGLLVRIGFTPAFDYTRDRFLDSNLFQLFGGISIGYSF